MDWEAVIGLGEFNHNRFLDGLDAELELAAYTKALGKLFNGHIETNKSADQLNLFPFYGAMNDHDVFSYEDVELSLRLGMPIQLREGLGCLDVIVPHIVNNHLPTDNMMLSTDNYSVKDLLQNGHMDFIVQKAINMGIKPTEAIKMATLNIAKNFRLDYKLGSIAPGRYADFLLIPNLSQIKPVYVFKGGEMVAKDGKLLKKVAVDYSDVLVKHSPGLDDLKKEDLELVPDEISADGKTAKVKVAGRKSLGASGVFVEEWLPYKDGKIVLPPDSDLNRISVIERSPEGGKRLIVNAYVAGYELEKGCISLVMPSPSHHFGIIGTDVDEIYFAAKELDKHSGGFMVSEAGKVKTLLTLPIYSFMSDLGAAEFAAGASKLVAEAAKLGCKKAEWYTDLNRFFYSLDRYGIIK